MSTPVTNGTLVTAVQSLAQSINGGQSGNSSSWSKGTVHAVNLTSNPRTVDIYLNGDTTTLVQGVLMADSYTPVVGDIALIAVQNGGQMMAMGQYSQPGTAAQNGWVQPTLINGTTTPVTSCGVWQARLQVVSGDLKVEMRGSANLSGSSTNIGTMPPGMAPSVDRFFLAGRDENGAIHVMIKVFSGTGAIWLAGANDASAYPTTSQPSSGNTGSTGLTTNSATDSFSVSVSGSTSGQSVSVSDSGSTGGASAGTAHTHGYSGSGSGSSGGGSFSGSGSGGTNGHSHGVNGHTHSIGHTHTSTPSFPAWVTFDNTSFYM